MNEYFQQQIASGATDQFCLQVQDAVREGWTIKGDEMLAEGKYIQCFIRFGVE